MIVATQLNQRLQIVAIIATLALFVLVFELVRQRRLQERYALLWMFSATVLFGLALWKDALPRIAEAVGIVSPPSALFAVALGFVFVLMLHFSLVISRLSDQNKVLAQRIGALDQRIAELENERPDGTGSAP